MVKNSLFILFSFKSPNVGVSLNFNALRLVLTAERLSASGSPSRPHGADVFQTQRCHQPISSKIEISSVIVCHYYSIISRWFIRIYRSPMEKNCHCLCHDQLAWDGFTWCSHLALKHSYQKVPVKCTIRPKDIEWSTLISTMSVESATVITVEFGSFWPCLNLSMRLCKARTRFDLAKGWK